MTKKPASTSCTMRCAPKPSATPTTAAGATRLLIGTPSRWTIEHCRHDVDEHDDRSR